MNKILVIEADANLAERLCRALRDTETHVFSCGTLEAATALMEKELYQQIIIDTELPDGDGYDLIYELGLGIYDSSSAPIILIASNGCQLDLTELGKLGISDYITKPFNVSVLKAKVCTQFKRQTREFSLRAISRSSIIGEPVVEIDDYIFNFDLGEFCVAGERVRLNRFEQCLLRNLVENKGVVLKKKALVEKIRMETRVLCIDETLLTEAVHMLSNKLKAQNYIKTVYGIGYLWTMAEEKNKSV